MRQNRVRPEASRPDPATTTCCPPTGLSSPPPASTAHLPSPSCSSVLHSCSAGSCLGPPQRPGSMAGPVPMVDRHGFASLWLDRGFQRGSKSSPSRPLSPAGAAWAVEADNLAVSAPRSLNSNHAQRGKHLTAAARLPSRSKHFLGVLGDAKSLTRALASALSRAELRGDRRDAKLDEIRPAVLSICRSL